MVHLLRHECLLFCQVCKAHSETLTAQLPALMQRGDLEEEEAVTLAIFSSMQDSLQKQLVGSTSSLSLQQVSMASDSSTLKIVNNFTECGTTPHCMCLTLHVRCYSVYCCTMRYTHGGALYSSDAALSKLDTMHYQSTNLQHDCSSSPFSVASPVGCCRNLAGGTKLSCLRQN